MFVALDTADEIAVTGQEVRHRATQKTSHNESDSYQCLFCGSTLNCTAGENTKLFNSFTHKDQHDCINTGNVSTDHRLAQEVVTKELVNWLPKSHETQIKIEQRVGTPSDFVITDICMKNPVRIAIEVIYRNRNMCLQRRLRTLFNQGYSVMFVVLTTGDLSAEQIEDDLYPIGPIDVGEFDPHSIDVKYGSLITPEIVDIDALSRKDIPAYVS